MMLRSEDFEFINEYKCSINELAVGKMFIRKEAESKNTIWWLMKTAPINETVKQTFHLKFQRIRRFEKRNRFYRENKIIASDVKKRFTYRLESRLWV